MKSPYEITGRILNLISSIAEQIGEIKSARLTKSSPELRRKNRIRTIQSSLEIEGNTLSVDQITDLIEGKRVLAPKKDIIEVKNAIQVYSNLDDFHVYSLDSLCNAHKVLMNNLVENSGKLRRGPVGIAKGKDIAHIAPPGEMVYSLLNDLFRYLKEDNDIFLIKSCVFHYEFEFIHPFTDGNGRMGRLWQTMILREYSPVFEFLPVETLIKERQVEYYEVLGKSDRMGKSTLFIEFMLQVIYHALEDLLKTQNISVKNTDRIVIFRNYIGNSEFSRQDYLRQNKDISPATASRDLRDAVEKGILVKQGDKRTAKYRFT